MYVDFKNTKTEKIICFDFFVPLSSRSTVIVVVICFVRSVYAHASPLQSRENITLFPWMQKSRWSKNVLLFCGLFTGSSSFLLGFILLVLSMQWITKNMKGWGWKVEKFISLNSKNVVGTFASPPLPTKAHSTKYFHENLNAFFFVLNKKDEN